MTMNPHTTASGLRYEARTAAKAQAAQAAASGARAAKKRLIGPAALFSAGFILAVTAIAKVFYE